jgi:D-proline reductase (dithiol) PrdB
VCHQSGGLLARVIEAAGLPTIVLGQHEPALKRVKPPRAVLTRFPRGATVGAPGHHEQQRQVLLDTLATLEEAATAGELYPLPYRWEGEAGD